MSPPWLIAKGNDTLLLVYVQPGAKASAIVGEHNSRLKIKLKAPPVDGAANEELISFLSKHLTLQSRKISLVKGPTSREKTVLIEEICSEVQKKLLL